MFGMFERDDLDKTIEFLDASGYEIVASNQKPSVYDTKYTVLDQKYRKENRIISMLFSHYKEPDENVTVDLKIVEDSNEEILKFCAETYDDIEKFVNASEAEINDMIVEARQERAKAVSSFMNSLKWYDKVGFRRNM